jgi:hypothetical protein
VTAVADHEPNHRRGASDLAGDVHATPAAGVQSEGELLLLLREDSQWQAICSVAEKLGAKAETVRLWVRRAEADEGRRPGPTSDELAELKRLKRENAELRRANDMAESTGGCTGPVTIRASRSQEQRHGRPYSCS